RPERSHHEGGPGQNEIDFRYSDPLTAADNVITFQTIVRTVAHRNGLHADFSPKPLRGHPGNGFHINFSVSSQDGRDLLPQVISGILEKAPEMTAFLNPTENSYKRFGQDKAPGYVIWSHENRNQLIRIPAAQNEYCRAELRSPDPTANPYIAFALTIYAGMYGIEQQLTLPDEIDFNLYMEINELQRTLRKLPESLKQAKQLAAESPFINEYIPAELVHIFCR
ncbi:MAG: type I glutamate--ammonia ligase, partial [Eubacterium sp.]|nr:type I glutamate--ammonia ligase [Eubacterium sp.]